MEAASPISAPGAEVRPAGETDIEQVREIGRDYGGLAAWPEAPDYLDHARVSSRLLVAAEGECSASGRSWRRRPHHLRLERSAGPDSARLLIALVHHAGQRADVVSLPAFGPHPAVPALRAAGFKLDDRDTFMASRPSLIDPRRYVPSPDVG